MRLGADVDQIRGDARKASLAVRAAGALFRLDKILVQFVHRTFESVSINSAFELRGKSGLELDGRAFAVVPLDEHLHVVGLRGCRCPWLGHPHYISSHLCEL